MPLSSVWARVGKRDLAMLALSNILILATGGISYLWQLYQVCAVAKTAPATIAAAPWLLVFGVHAPQGAITHDFALRLEKARALHEQDPNSRIVVLGGRQGADGRTEATIGAEYLRTRGVPKTCVMPEDKSSNTVENLRYARQILGTSLGNPVVLISNRYHLARTRFIAKNLGISHTLCAAEERLYLNAHTLVRILQEAYYLHWAMAGSAWAWLTDRRPYPKAWS